MPLLEIIDPDGERVLEAAEFMTFGSSRRCTVRLADRSLSRIHCEIVRRPDGWWLKDRGVRNRTFVNGLPVTETILKPGDRIDIGRSLVRFDPQALLSPPVGSSRLERRRWLTPWRLAASSVAVTALLIGGLYATPDSLEFAVGAVRFRRGPTEELTRKVVAVAIVVTGIHIAIFTLTSLLGRRPRR